MSEILNEKEKEYLSNFIKPFRNGVLAITKYNYSNGDEYLQIEVNLPNRFECIKLPYFEKGTMYKGMKLGFTYILKELEL